MSKQVYICYEKYSVGPGWNNSFSMTKSLKAFVREKDAMNFCKEKKEECTSPCYYWWYESIDLEEK